MKERFKKYLEREFKRIAPTKAAMEYREEVLSNLLDKAHELKIKGITDENMIYEMCIDDLGDFYLTLKDFESARKEIKENAKKAALAMVFSITAILFVVIAYLVISLLTKAWDKTWLIFILAAFFGISGLGAVKMPTLYKKRKIVLIKLYVTASITLLSVSIFLCLVMLTTLPYLYFVFLVLPIVITLGLTIVSVSLDSKLKYLDATAFIMTATPLLYVILSITMVIPWSLGWLLPVGGVFTVCLMFTVVLLMNKKTKKITGKKSNDEENDEYYTTWKDL